MSDVGELVFTADDARGMVAEERAAIVAYLRWSGSSTRAGDIERGVHRIPEREREPTRSAAEECSAVPASDAARCGGRR